MKYDRERVRRELIDAQKEVLDEPGHYEVMMKELNRARDESARHIRLSDGDDEELKKEQFYARAQATTKFYKELLNVKKTIETEYRKELWVKKERYPLKWMKNDELILRTIETTRLIPLLNFLEGHNLDRKDSYTQILAKGHKFSTKAKNGKLREKKVEYIYSLILVNNEFYKQATKELGIGKIYLQKHLQALCKIGALKRVVRTGESGREWLYADGYYTMVGGLYMKHYFLKKEREVIDGLRKFRSYFRSHPG